MIISNRAACYLAGNGIFCTKERFGYNYDTGYRIVFLAFDNSVLHRSFTDTLYEICKKESGRYSAGRFSSYVVCV